MIEVREYVDAGGHSAFERWFEDLDVLAAAKVTVAVERLAQGNRSNLKSVGEGVSEYRLDHGPGYRIYFGRDGETLVILLGGGTKARQDKDIIAAHAAWHEYKTRKKQAAKADQSPNAKQQKRKKKE